ncbi:MAG: cell division protein FtsW [Stenotrophomonas rhizophila]|jgi:cell division protein FtsW|uniref:putative lipid II flippase FtsW n=1 Tax=Stenotrophomonas TaxID=40323 RepID=UPI000BA556C3|nr:MULTISPECIES: putative lipid II flippase FtsW [Stenotrophomonas]MDF2818967.1 cell division protein FtsW [Stenotrophomonas rhizophila]MDQ1063848.1 cell division protein FtsW [Stenotrophomonas sp. SORGH_AS_0282]MDQ1187784.1 cell division protein FtsW [Stenotrophomonas sp. SORGH_AS_0282]PAK90522.1 putative lipid II flippase FtsW [Stenotrophomonas rhizophila]
MNDLSRQATRLEAIGGHFDKWLLGAIITLTGLGVVMVASSSIALMSSPFYYLNRHLIFLAVGIVLAALAMRTELKSIEQYNQMLLLGCFALLVVVFIPGLGSSVNGARRWINLGFSKFQTVEAVKVLYIVWLSSYLVRFRDEVNATWPAMLKPLGVAGALVVLLLLQPDFGSSTLLLAITAGMLVLGGVNLPRMSMPIVFGLVAMSALAIIEPYRMRRITSFWDPWADQQGDGYQLSNALMAVGRGEWTGVGLGNSVQKLYYLPEAHTDFIFSVTAEELGFVGTCLIVALYALLAGRAFWIGMRCVEMKRHFSGYIAFGIGLWVSMQSFVSIGVNLGILPTKGLTLPLISSGGSSILMTCVAMGLLLRVSYELDRAERRQAVRMGAAELDDAAPVDAPARASAVAAAMQESSARASAQRDSAPRGTSRMQQRIEPTLGRMG